MDLTDTFCGLCWISLRQIVMRWDKKISTDYLSLPDVSNLLDLWAWFWVVLMSIIDVPNVENAIPGHEGLGYKRKQAEQHRGIKPVSSVCQWSLLQFLLPASCLISLVTDVKGKDNKTFLSQVTFCQGFVTTREKQSRKLCYRHSIFGWIAILEKVSPHG